MNILPNPLFLDMNYQTLQELIDKGEEAHLPHLSVDCVIFGLYEDQLKVLVLQIGDLDLWSLPGGHVRRDESVDEAAFRVLKLRTGLDDIFLKQFKTFGAANRNYPADMKLVMEKLGQVWNPDSWLGQRFVSVGYYALVDYTKLSPTGGEQEQQFQWSDIRQLPPLMMDHRQIVEEAYQVLQQDLYIKPIGYNLLPEKFTMPELQRMYEAILGVALERSHFQKKMLRLNIYERLEERKEGVAHKRPYLYRFKPEQYEEALSKGLRFEV